MSKKRLRLALRALNRVVIYVRISMDRTVQYTEDIQITHGKQVAAFLQVEVVDIIIDKDLTGTLFDTRRIMEIIEMSRREEIDGVIVIHTNRWGRNSPESQRHERLLRDSGACLIAGGQIIDTSTSSGKLAFAFSTVVDENGAALISEAWIRAHENRHERGMPHSGRLRLGYTRCPKCERNPMNERAYVRCKSCEGVLQINEDTSDKVLEMCRRYGKGESGLMLAAHFNAAGVRSNPTKKYPTGKRMSWSDWRSSLDTGFAAGYLRSDVGNCIDELQKWVTWTLYTDPDTGETYYLPPEGWARGKHKAIIPSEEWREYVLRRIAQSDPVTRTRAPKYSVSTFVRCYARRETGDICRSSMSARPRSGGIVNFRCPRHVHVGDCEGVQISLRRLEDCVLKWLKANASGEEHALAAVQRTLSDKDDRKRLVRLEKRRAEIEDQQDALALAVARKSVPERSAKRLTDQYETDLHEVDQEIKSLAPRVKSAAPPPREAFENMFALWPKLSPQKRREALAHVVDHIAVYKGEGTSWSRAEIVPAWESEQEKIKRRVDWAAISTAP